MQMVAHWTAVASHLQANQHHVLSYSTAETQARRSQFRHTATAAATTTFPFFHFSARRLPFALKSSFETYHISYHLDFLWRLPPVAQRLSLCICGRFPLLLLYATSLPLPHNSYSCLKMHPERKK